MRIRILAVYARNPTGKIPQKFLETDACTLDQDEIHAFKKLFQKASQRQSPSPIFVVYKELILYRSSLYIHCIY